MLRIPTIIAQPAFVNDKPSSLISFPCVFRALPRRSCDNVAQKRYAKDIVRRKAFRITELGRHVSMFMYLYATGDMARRVSAPPETESLNNKTRHNVTAFSF